MFDPMRASMIDSEKNLRNGGFTHLKRPRVNYELKTVSKSIHESKRTPPHRTVNKKEEVEIYEQQFDAKKSVETQQKQASNDIESETKKESKLASSFLDGSEIERQFRSDNQNRNKGNELCKSLDISKIAPDNVKESQILERNGNPYSPEENEAYLNKEEEESQVEYDSLISPQIQGFEGKKLTRYALEHKTAEDEIPSNNKPQGNSVTQNYSSEKVITRKTGLDPSPTTPVRESGRALDMTSPKSPKTPDTYCSFFPQQSCHLQLIKTIKINDFLVYIGPIFDDVFDGFGKILTNEGDLIFEGEFERGYYNGKGKLNNHLNFQKVPKASTIYNFADIKFVGANWISYNGFFHQGLRHGVGKVKMQNGNVYFGEFKAGQANGYGMFWDGERSIAGIWKEDKLEKLL